MQSHAVADEKFPITASAVMNLAQKARHLFDCFEVDEKRQILNLVFQNLRLEGKKLALKLREPFHTAHVQQGLSCKFSIDFLDFAWVFSLRTGELYEKIF